ncbi:chromatin modification-related protein eaf-1 [Cyclospora cayetanensis]|uniref:Chromatin modification-related protein eaf-1 n=1 Tax=Cyclospora cayetanensis TaxID=88456 RepID=A0A6P6RRB1_9EIME|nr:chromatin modification-related protein eaf-1 [Cyclospora cayetanensis]
MKVAAAADMRGRSCPPPEVAPATEAEVKKEIERQQHLSHTSIPAATAHGQPVSLPATPLAPHIGERPSSLQGTAACAAAAEAPQQAAAAATAAATAAAASRPAAAAAFAAAAAAASATSRMQSKQLQQRHRQRQQRHRQRQQRHRPQLQAESQILPARQQLNEAEEELMRLVDVPEVERWICGAQIQTLQQQQQQQQHVCRLEQQEHVQQLLRATKTSQNQLHQQPQESDQREQQPAEDSRGKEAFARRSSSTMSSGTTAATSSCISTGARNSTSSTLTGVAASLPSAAAYSQYAVKNASSSSVASSGEGSGEAEVLPVIVDLRLGRHPTPVGAPVSPHVAAHTAAAADAASVRQFVGSPPQHAAVLSGRSQSHAADTSGSSSLNTLAGSSSCSNIGGSRPRPSLSLPSLQQRMQKTKMCRFHLQGCCSKGPLCVFAHDARELRERPNLIRTRLCPYMTRTASDRATGSEQQQQGPLSCSKGDACKFAHSVEELRSTPEFFKTAVCPLHAAGGPKACPSGAACRFAHGEAELRPRPHAGSFPSAAPAVLAGAAGGGRGGSAAIEASRRATWGGGGGALGALPCPPPGFGVCGEAVFSRSGGGGELGKTGSLQLSRNVAVSGASGALNGAGVEAWQQLLMAAQSAAGGEAAGGGAPNATAVGQRGAAPTLETPTESAAKSWAVLSRL